MKLYAAEPIGVKVLLITPFGRSLSDGGGGGGERGGGGWSAVVVVVEMQRRRLERREKEELEGRNWRIVKKRDIKRRRDIRSLSSTA